MQQAHNNQTTQPRTPKHTPVVFNMKKRPPLLQFLAAAFIATASLVSSCSKEQMEQRNTPGNQDVKNSLQAAKLTRIPTYSIAYIYKKDSSDAADYKALMQANNCQVTLIEKNTSAKVNYKGYNLIVIDNNTGTLSFGNSEWTASQAKPINDAGKPMLLMGQGGVEFAYMIGNAANDSLAPQFYGTGFYVLDKTSPIYQTPKTIPLPAPGKELTLYTKKLIYNAIWDPKRQLPDVKMIGHCTFDSRYYTITYEKKRYTIFGFSNGIKLMTKTGKDFLVNLTYFTGKF